MKKPVYSKEAAFKTVELKPVNSIFKADPSLCLCGSFLLYPTKEIDFAHSFAFDNLRFISKELLR
jgi:hypothetical protein